MNVFIKPYLVTYLSMLLVALFSACSQSNNTNSITLKEDQEGKVSFTVPSAISATALDGSPDAYILIDGDNRQQMQINNNQAQLTITGLTPGEHSFSIEFEFDSATYGVIMLAKTVSLTVNLSTGNNSLGFSESDYSYPDDDSDSYLNIVELEQGTDPTNPSSKPPLDCTVVNGIISCSEKTYSVGGTVIGLVGDGLVLQNNNTDAITINTNSAFTFETALADGSNFEVTVLNQPANPAQTCSVSGGSGVLNGANFENVVINCQNNSFTVGGSVSGLSPVGTGLRITLNDTNELLLKNDGGYTFPVSFIDGDEYNVAIINQPASPNQTCAINNASGMVNSANIANVFIECQTNTYTVSGSITSLTGSGLVLQNNATDNLPLAAGDSVFGFITALKDGEIYDVTVLNQPTNPDQLCTVFNGSGTLNGAAVTDVTVICNDQLYNIGVIVNGLQGNGLVLQNNAGDDLSVNADGQYNFQTRLLNGNSYAVTVLNQVINPNQLCSVSNGSGVVSGADISNIIINCISQTTTLNVDVDIKQLQFSWLPVAGAIYYRILQNPDNASGFSSIIGDIPSTKFNATISAHLLDWINASYQLEACDGVVCINSTHVSVTDKMLDSIGYIKAANTSENSFFGNVVALSDDGTTMAIGSGLGIYGVHIYTTDENGNWSLQAFIADPNGTSPAGIGFGNAVALSANGDTLAVGDMGDASSATGINGTGTIDPIKFGESGAVYIYTRNATGNWGRQVYIKAQYTDINDHFGNTVALSADGNTLAVGAYWDDTAATKVDGNDISDCLAATPLNCAEQSGAAYVFNRNSNNLWSQQAYIKAPNTDARDHFGLSLALSGDGNTLAVGAPDEDSSANTINGNFGNDAEFGQGWGSGAAYVYDRDINGVWVHETYIKASNTARLDTFGSSIDLSDDGNTLVIGADEKEVTSIPDAGSVYVFNRINSVWAEQVILTTSIIGPYLFGSAVALSSDGKTLAIGAPGENGISTGVNGDENNTSILFNRAGAAYIFAISQDNNSSWQQNSYIKATDTEAADSFGMSVALSGDSQTLAVGASSEDSAASEVNGNQIDDCEIAVPLNCAKNSGAVYLY